MADVNKEKSPISERVSAANVTDCSRIKCAGDMDKMSMERKRDSLCRKRWYSFGWASSNELVTVTVILAVFVLILSLPGVNSSYVTCCNHARHSGKHQRNLLFISGVCGN